LARPRRRDWGPLLARGSLRLSPEPSRVAFGDVSLPVLSHPIPREFPVSGSVNLSMGNTIPGQVEMSVRDGLRIWDAKARRELSQAEASGITLQCETKIDVDLRLKFVAKVALSAGYFAYADVFKDHVQHQE